MSTKIYSGFRWSTSDPFTIVPTLHAALVSERDRLTQRASAGLMVMRAIAERLADRPYPTPVTNWRGATDLIAKAENSPLRDPLLDLAVTVTLLRSPLDRGHIFGIVYAEQSSFLAAVLEAGAEPFPYWDNTDRPGDVSESDWEWRRTAWNAALGGDGYASPASVGLSVTVDHRTLSPAWFADDAMQHLVQEAIACASASDEKVAALSLDAASILGRSEAGS